MELVVLVFLNDSHLLCSSMLGQSDTVNVICLFSGYVASISQVVITFLLPHIVDL